MSSIRYETPTDLEALAQCLGRATERTHLLGGGTDLLPKFHGRIPVGTTLIDMTGIRALDTLEITAETVAIGANVTYARLAQEPFVQARIPCLSTMASQIGSVQVRNLACLPGNLANASPGGDALGTLMALDAVVTILDAQGRTRSIEVADLVLGIGRTSLAMGEAIIGIRVPVPPSARSGFGKIGLGARSQVVIANVSLTMVFTLAAGDHRIGRARIVLGSAAPKAFRALEAEKACLHRRPSAAMAAELAESLRGNVQDSIRGNPLFQHKLNDVQGLAQDVFHAIFHDLIQE
ncbi:MAG: FAD binding domain-containing protein [Candidatus Taylorbacteria bacterium]